MSCWAIRRPDGWYGRTGNVVPEEDQFLFASEGSARRRQQNAVAKWSGKLLAAEQDMKVREARAARMAEGAEKESTLAVGLQAVEHARQMLEEAGNWRIVENFDFDEGEPSDDE